MEAKTKWPQFSSQYFQMHFLYENVWISLKFVPKVRINNIPALVQIIIWANDGKFIYSSYIRHSASMN